MAYSNQLAKVYTVIKNLVEGQEVKIGKEVAVSQSLLCIEDVAEWAQKANSKVKVTYRSCGQLYTVRLPINEIDRLRKVMQTARYNQAYCTMCTPEQVKAMYLEEQIKAKLEVWTGLATYFRLEK